MKYPSEPRWIVETLGGDRDDWIEFIAIVLNGKNRTHYQLAHNGQRFAKGHGFVDLGARYPSVLVEITAWMERLH
jgi:hypothetical protein